MSDTDYLLQHVQAMSVRQARIHKADTRWYIVTANGYVVRGPFTRKELAEVSLKSLRRRAREEFAEGAA